jgi:hypothetical protein
MKRATLSNKLIKTIKPSYVKTYDDIFILFLKMMHELDLNFHPDTDFRDYVKEDNTATFTEDEAIHYNHVMKVCRQLCETNDWDIYEIAMNATKITHPERSCF